VTLSGLLKHTPKFLGRHGWPVASVMATNSSFPVSCNASVGQDIVFVGLAIDNYLIHRAQNLVLRDPQMLQVLKRIFP
jgi:hypothetical protein